MRPINKLDLSEMLFRYVITHNGGVRLRTMKGCTFHFTRNSPMGGSFVKGIDVHRESGFLQNRKSPFMGPFLRQEFIKWIISNVSVEEMYNTINRIDGLMFPE